MDVPLSNKDIHQALKSENGFREGVQLRPVAESETWSVLRGEHRQHFTSMGSSGGRTPLADGCREKDHVWSRFDSFGRSLEQMEQNYTEPNLKQ